MHGLAILIVTGIAMFAVIGAITMIDNNGNLNHIKNKTVGNGQHGTARWATAKEIQQTYRHIPVTPSLWRAQAAQGKTPTDKNGKALPQGIVVGCQGKRRTVALVDTGDVHVLMIGAAGVVSN